PTTVNPTGAVLSWTRWAGAAAFQRYEVHRSLTPNFTPSAATRLATITNIDTTSYTDTTGDVEETYTYKIVANTTRSNEQTVTLPPLGYTTKILQPGPATGKDVTIFNNTDDPNSCRNTGSDPTLLVGTTARAVNRALLSFDLSTIPASASITQATLSLWAQQLAQTPLTVDVH